MREYNVVMVGSFPDDPEYMKGGVEASVFGLSHAMSKLPNIRSVRVFALPDSNQTDFRTARIRDIDVTYLDVPHKLMASITFYVPLMLRTIGGLRDPVVHIHGTGAAQAILFMILRARRISFVWTMHGITEKETLKIYQERKTMPNALRYVFYRILERSSVKIAPDIIVDTVYVQNEISAANRVHVIPQGIPGDEFFSLGAHNREAQLLISIGVIDPRKGHHLAIEAFDKIRSKIPGVRLAIAGSLTDPTYYESLKSLVDELGLGGFVEIHVNAKKETILELYERGSVFILHSREESQGIALCEALAAGLPVVASRVGGIPYVVTDQLDGFLVQLTDTTASANAVIRLFSEPELYARMSGQARKSAKRFEWLEIASKINGLYNTL